MNMKFQELIKDLKGIKLAIFDLDGVVYLGQTLIPKADEVIQALKDLSIKVVYNSNNSTITRGMYVERLRKFNISCDYSDFYTSASITAQEITAIKKKSKIFVIGENGLREELKALGHDVVIKPSKSQYKEIDFVVVGLDLHFNYANLALAQRCILEGGARFYATNSDTTLPVSDGLMPGAGVMVNAVTTCTGQEPIRIFGKPQPDGINLIVKDISVKPEEAIIFGDRLETDILAGNRAGIKTALVLTGVSNLEMISTLEKDNNADKKLLPNFIFTSLTEIFKHE
ncbi:MAG: HAD-IIA family hydrolase [Candidatus Lokiarchaeota archaeon]|nr:HAD-IIA family hydrolase [Candidatus Lokiarchaeota archaeon]